MPIDPNTLSKRVSSSFSKLSSVANDLNAVSDELGTYVAQIDDALKKLNLGVVSWVTIYSGDDADRNPQYLSYWSEDLGYAKVNGKWGVCIRRLDGDHSGSDEESETLWLFNDAARPLRLAAIDKLPELLESLSKEATNTTKQIHAKLADVRAVVAVLNPPKPTKPTNNTSPKGSAAKARADVPEPHGIAKAMMEHEQQTAEFGRAIADAQRAIEIPQIAFQEKVESASQMARKAFFEAAGAVKK